MGSSGLAALGPAGAATKHPPRLPTTSSQTDIDVANGTLVVKILRKSPAGVDGLASKTSPFFYGEQVTSRSWMSANPIRYLKIDATGRPSTELH